MPINTITSKIINFKIVGLISIRIVEAKEIVAETIMVTIKMVTTQRIVLLRSFLAADGSDLDTDQFPSLTLMLFDYDGSRQDKSYGLGRVDFLQTEPAVTAQAVSI